MRDPNSLLAIDGLLAAHTTFAPRHASVWREGAYLETVPEIGGSLPGRGRAGPI